MAAEGPQQRIAQDQALATNAIDHDWPRDPFGTPMVKIQAAAAELVPTVQYGNVTVGPVVVTRFVPAATTEQIKEAIKETQEIVETAISEDRATVHALMRSRSAA